MTTSNDLMFAILSMDAYDQGYGAGIGNMPAQIGNATRQFDSSVLDTPGNVDVAKSAGFYAVAYTYGGQTAIAYRGTDNKSLSDSATQGGSDVLNGYSLAAGNFLAPQAEMAAQFYLSVDSSVGITVTAHSIGFPLP
jgi:hypothetical protein